MALVLAMQVGRSFYVDDTQVAIEGSATPGTVTVLVHDEPAVRLELSTDQRTEVLPDVWAQLGLGSGPNTLKVLIEAPKHVRILRDSLYEGTDE